MSRPALGVALLLLFLAPTTGRARDCTGDPGIKSWYYGNDGGTGLTEALCAQVPEDCASQALFFNPAGSQVFYLKSECFRRLATYTSDPRYCAFVRPMKALFLDGSDYTKEKCVRTVTAKRDREEKERQEREASTKRDREANELAAKKSMDEQNALAKKRYDEYQQKINDPAERAKNRELLRRQGVAWWGGADQACGPCGYDGGDGRTNRCAPGVCAVRAYYRCAPQDPPLRFENDPRIVGLIHDKTCKLYDKPIDPNAIRD